MDYFSLVLTPITIRWTIPLINIRTNLAVVPSFAKQQDNFGGIHPSYKKGKFFQRLHSDVFQKEGHITSSNRLTKFEMNDLVPHGTFAFFETNWLYC
jgi:hypothetical protein